VAFADDLKAGIDRAIRIVKLDRATMAQVALDEKALVVGVVIAAIAGLASGIGSITQGVTYLFLMPPAFVIGSFIGVGLIYLAGLLFKPPRWDYMQLYRTLSHSYILSWVGVLSIIPFLGALIAFAAAVYQLVVSVVTVETLGKVDRGKAILIVLIPLVVCCGVIGIGMLLFGAAIMAALGGGLLSR
jgi:hypothetical protein